MINALSIDVEDYYMVSGFADIVRFEDWGTYESRVEKNTYRILDMLNEQNVKATFFVLGWVAKRCSKLVRDIHACGHEVACHGYNHRLIYDLTPEQFREDIRKAKGILEDIVCAPVIGYRAASYSIVKETLWALGILVEEGFAYDSSIFPIMHDMYGIPDAERFPHEITTAAGNIQEFPLTTLPYRVFGREVRFPIAGGGYLRLLPVWFVSQGIRQVNRSEGRPAVVYFHPWELDPEQPRIPARWKSRFRHYLNLDKMERKIVYLLARHRFAPLKNALLEVFPTATPSPQPLPGSCEVV